jgi:type I restriction-modification system DNA methylase subunit
MTNTNTPLALHKVEQFISNVRVIEELAKDSPDIQKLKIYKGFGGLKKCFWDKNLYGQLMRAIRANFGSTREKDILESLRTSSSSAYYTPPEVINFIYRYLDQVCKFKGGEVLEPSCGNGAFFEYMPEAMKTNSQVTGIEYDTLTSKLVQTIYPEVKIINDGLQNIDFAGKKFNLIIGNPPYSSEKITDNFMPDLNGYTIHHYFVAKCVRLLKDDGLMALVVPSFYMDIPRANTRHIVDNESVVIDVVRLPDNLFIQANVTVDIIFIRKTGKKIHDITKVTEFKDGNAKDSINEYWLNNPNRILGKLKLKWVNAYNRHVPTCEAENKEDILKKLNSFEFTQWTIDNFLAISGERSTTDNLLLETGDQVYEIFTEIEELELIVRDLAKRLMELHTRTWNLANNIVEDIV